MLIIPYKFFMTENIFIFKKFFIQKYFRFFGNKLPFNLYPVIMLYNSVACLVFATSCRLLLCRFPVLKIRCMIFVFKQAPFNFYPVFVITRGFSLVAIQLFCFSHKKSKFIRIKIFRCKKLHTTYNCYF